MSSFVYNPLDSISVTHMPVSVEGIYKGMSRLPAPHPPNLTLPSLAAIKYYQTLSSRGTSGVFPPSMLQVLTCLILWRQLCNCWCHVQRTAFHNSAPSLWLTLLPLPLQHCFLGHWATASTADHLVTYSKHFEQLCASVLATTWYNKMFLRLRLEAAHRNI